MSSPLLFVNSEDGQIYKIKEAEVVTLESVDIQIAHCQNRLSDLNVERQKIVDLQAELDAADQSGTDNPNPSPTEAPADPAPAAPASDPAPADQPAPAAPTPPADANAENAPVPPIAA